MPNKPEATISNRVPASVEIFHVNVPESGREELSKDPEKYLRSALESAGQKVNGVIVSKEVHDSITHPGPGPAKPLDYVVVHVESKGPHSSKHIVIKMPGT